MTRGPVAKLLLTLAGRPPLNGLYRSAVRWRFRRFRRIHADRPVLEWVAGYPILVLPEVLNPRLFYSGEFLAGAVNEIQMSSDTRVLDMGTGTGIIAVAAAHQGAAAAHQGAQVVAVDINPAAVRAARVNALLNEVETAVDVREGDLFAAVADERFDVVIFNPVCVLSSGVNRVLRTGVN
jgi:release factor glutamine methyltransferase